jgi:hypothetical protein
LPAAEPQAIGRQDLEGPLMLQPGTLTAAFLTYWADMDRCRTAKACWSLLHVTVCLPDICAALQLPDGQTHQPLYISWCDKFFLNPLLRGAERYRMRCKVLHQGRARTEKPGRYSAFSFGEPSPDGAIDHSRVENSVLNLDVGELATETKAAVNAWIGALEADLSSPEALSVERNLASLVRVTSVVVPKSADGFQMTYVVNKTT